MKDINIVIDSQTHKVQFPDNFLGLNAENLQGNINFTFTNGFVNGIARLELSIDCESGFIPNLQNTGDSYTLPILSSLLTSDNIVMQLVIEQTDLITYKLTTDTSINNQKTYYTRSGVEGEYVYTIVENPKVADIGTYYEAQIPIFKTHIFNMTVGESINAVNTIPDDYPTWIDTLNSLVGQVNAKIIEMNQALAEVDNLDITATKEGTTVTITITRKDGSQQVVTITDGKDGVGIEKIEKTDTTGLVDTYTIYYTDDSTSTFQVKNGRGIVSIDKTNTNILTDTYTITYNDNTTSTFYVVNGNGVESIVKIGTSGLIDTYRISYTNGEYYDYQVANGNGIDNIQKTDTTGLVDTYTITYTNGTTSTYIITNGNGISNIAKTSTVDNVDTYTIYYTNGTTSTFTVTNSTVTNQEFQELQRLVDYNALYANALIKMNNSGTDLTINDTANAPMPMKLAPSELEQETTTGSNLQKYNVRTNTDVNVNYKCDDNGQITLNGQANASSGFAINQSGNEIALESGTYIGKLIGILGNVSKVRVNVDGTITDYNLDSNNEYTFILNANANVRILISVINGVTYNSNFYVTLAKNTATTEKYTGGIASPNPDYPQDIHTISGDNTIKVTNSDNTQEQSLPLNLGDLEYCKIGNYEDEFVIPDNQLFDEEMELGSIVIETGVNASSTTNIRTKNYIPIQPNTQYTLTSSVANKTKWGIYYDKNKSYLGYIKITDQATSGTITSIANAYYLRFYEFNNTDLTTKYMLNKGNIALPYEPYNPYGKWYLKKNIGKVVFNGTETITYNSTTQVFFSAVNDVNTSIEFTPICNYFIGQSKINIFTDLQNNKVSFRKNASNLFFKNTSITSLDDFKTWLSTHNTEVYYILATPQYIPLNDTLQSQLTEIYKWVKAYQEQTNISQVNNDLPFIINTITCYDLNKLLTRVEVLESEV